MTPAELFVQTTVQIASVFIKAVKETPQDILGVLIGRWMKRKKDTASVNADSRPEENASPRP